MIGAISLGATITASQLLEQILADRWFPGTPEAKIWAEDFVKRTCVMSEKKVWTKPEVILPQSDPGDENDAEASMIEAMHTGNYALAPNPAQVARQKLYEPKNHANHFILRDDGVYLNGEKVSSGRGDECDQIKGVTTGNDLGRSMIGRMLDAAQDRRTKEKPLSLSTDTRKHETPFPAAALKDWR